MSRRSNHEDKYLRDNLQLKRHDIEFLAVFDVAGPEYWSIELIRLNVCYARPNIACRTMPKYSLVYLGTE